MKTYKEIAAALFDRRDAYYARRAKRQKTALAVVSGVCCVGLAVLLGFGLRQDAGTIPAAGSSEGTVTAPDTPSAVSDGYGAVSYTHLGDIFRSWKQIRQVSLECFHRTYMRDRLWCNDPDCALVHNIPLSVYNAGGDRSDAKTAVTLSLIHISSARCRRMRRSSRR